MAARRAHNPEVVGSSPASATISKALLFSNSKASFYAKNLMGFHYKHFRQLDSAKPCLTDLAIFVGRHPVGAPLARKQGMVLCASYFL